jgi:pyruvate/2-oxoglutarate dehydrogenase complex dihydrolipoamide acyltransferase (E2) component
MAVSGPALADTGETAAAAPTAAAAAASATAASRKGATAAPKAAPAPQAAVAATYCEAAMASLPTAEGAMRRTRAAARKDVVATATASSAGAVTSPSSPAPPAKRKRKRPQPVEPTSGQSGADAERMGAIPQLDGDVSLGAETGLLLATPLPPPPSAPLLTTTPLPPNDSATVKNLCRSCNTAPVFNYERSICIECLEKLVCKNCFTRSSEYRLKYQFFKYIYDYCQVECKK